MEITAEQKALLEAMEPDIEDAFLVGVTQGGSPFLPALPQYDKIPASLRPQGRKGIMSTFASFVKQLATQQPPQTAIGVQTGISNLDGTYTKNSIGEVVLSGRVNVLADTTGQVPIAILPVGYRPTKHACFVTAATGGATIVFVATSGVVYTETNLVAGWLALDGIRFVSA